MEPLTEVEINHIEDDTLAVEASLLDTAPSDLRTLTANIHALLAEVRRLRAALNTAPSA